MFGDILDWKKKGSLDYKNKELIKNQELEFFLRGTPIFWVKTLKLFHIFIVGKEGKEKVFGDILDTKKGSMTIKTRS